MKKINISILLLPLLLFFTSCGSGNSAAENKGNEKSTTAETQKMTMRNANDTVQIKCTVVGWKGSQCKFADNAASQVTRSDWLVKWDGECYYVTGGLPGFIQLFDNSSFGKSILLKAVLRNDKEGKVYLQYIDCNEIVN